MFSRIFAVVIIVFITIISIFYFLSPKIDKVVEVKNRDITTAHAQCTNESPDNIHQELQIIFTSLPHRIAQETLTHILKQPIEFLCDAKEVLQNTPKDVLKLVDKQHSIKSYTPRDLIQLENYKSILTLNKKGLQLRKVATEALLKMAEDATKESIILPISSAYRSYEYQRKVFARNVKILGKTRTVRESAPAGTSQHQLGLAVDFGCICSEFENTQASFWLVKHAWKYGFSLSFPKNQEHITGYIFESWHYRYIGKYTAAFEKKYFTRGQQHVLELLQYEERLLKL